jgi:hypothetical protein
MQSNQPIPFSQTFVGAVLVAILAGVAVLIIDRRTKGEGLPPVPAEISQKVLPSDSQTPSKGTDTLPKTTPVSASKSDNPKPEDRSTNSSGTELSQHHPSQSAPGQGSSELLPKPLPQSGVQPFEPEPTIDTPRKDFNPPDFSTTELGSQLFNLSAKSENNTYNASVGYKYSPKSVGPRGSLRLKLLDLFGKETLYSGSSHVDLHPGTGSVSFEFQPLEDFTMLEFCLYENDTPGSTHDKPIVCRQLERVRF